MRLLGWMLAGAVALCCYLALYERANPEASINLTTDRVAALELAEAFLEEQGWDVDGYRHAVTFHARQTDKEYLEKELALDEANRLMRDEVSVWGWLCRWYRFEEVEQFWVEVSPDGRIVGFWHEVEEAAQGESLASDEALNNAQAFLAARQGLDVDEYALVIENQKERPNRIDHFFVWERNDFRAKEATYRVAVSVFGDRIGHFSEQLKIPEEWLRARDSEASRRGLLMGAATIGYWLFCVAAGVVLLLELRARRLRAGFGLVVVLVLAAVQLAEWANWWPLRWIAYDTRGTLGAFVGDEVLSLLADTTTTVLAVLAFALPGEVLGRRVFPDKAPLSKILRAKFWFSHELFVASVVGCCLAMLHAAYVTVFYLGAETVGAWSPQSWPYWDILATPLPWLHPLTIGLSAAVNEELTFRLFAIALILRVTKRRWAAVMIPAIVWAFLHSNYPQEPIYIRGVELTVVGIVYGMVFVRYGFFASFISHFAFNALATSQILLRSGDAYLQFSGAATVALMFIALLPGLATLLRRKRLATNEEVWADGENVVRYPLGQGAAQRATAPGFRPYIPLAPRRWLTLCALTALSALILVWMPYEEEDPFASVSVARPQARSLADAFMRDKGIDPDAYRVSMTFHEDLNGTEFEYLYRHIDEEAFEETCRKRFAGRAAWFVRYLRPGEKEEYRVWILPDGRVYSFSHTLPEDAPGGQLTRDEALQLAEEHLRHKDLALEDYRLVGERAYEHAARNDYFFEWEDTTAKVGEGAWRVSLSVLGEEPERFWSYLDVPEAWILERHKREFLDTVKAGLSMGAGALGFAVLIWLFVRYFLKHAFEWRGSLLVAAVCAVVALALRVNAFSAFWSGYRTATPPALFLTWTLFTECLLLPVVVLFAGASTFALCDTLFRRSFPHIHPTSHWLGKQWLQWDGESRTLRRCRLPLRLAWGEAILVGVMVTIVISAGDALVEPLDAAIPALREATGPLFERILSGADKAHQDAPSLYVLGGNDTFIPAVDAAGRSLLITVAMGAFGLAATGLYRRVLKRKKWPLILLLAFASAAFTVEHATSPRAVPAEAVVLFAQGLVSLAVIGAMVRWFLRDNLPAYVAGIFLALLYQEAERLTRTANAFEKANGLALFGLFGAIVVLGLLFLVLSRRRREERPHQPGHTDESVSPAD